MMRLGFVSAILPDCSLEEVFATAAELDYQCVELMCWPPGAAERRYAGVTHIDVDQLDDTEVGRIADLSRQYGIEISSLGYYPNPMSANEAEASVAVEHLQRLIDASAKLNIHRVTTFLGRDPAGSVEANWEKFLKTWPPIIQTAADNQVHVGIENCPMFYTNDEWPGGKNLAVSPAIWRRMFEAIDSPYFGLNYDPSHLVWMQMDPIRPLREFASRLVHVHAKDVRIDRERLDDVGILATPLEYHCPKLPGLGEIDWGRFFSVLGDVGYRGPVCVEVEDRVYEDSLASRKQSLQQCSTFLRNFIPRSPSD